MLILYRFTYAFPFGITNVDITNSSFKMLRFFNCFIHKLSIMAISIDCPISKKVVSWLDLPT